VRSEKSSKNTCFFELQKCAKHRKKGGPHLPLLGDPPIYTVFKMPPAHSDFSLPPTEKILQNFLPAPPSHEKIFAIMKKNFFFFLRGENVFFVMKKIPFFSSNVRRCVASSYVS
jgi:hypothetical protein